jgi:hypothetical protein
MSFKIDVEPLADARVSKIKKALFERLDEEEFCGRVSLVERRHVSMSDHAAFGGRAVGLAGAWSTFRLLPRRWVRPARVALAVGAAAAVVLIFVWRRRPIAHAVFADNPSRIVTGPSASHLALGESSIDVSPDSVVLANGDDDRGVLLVLERGTVTCDVAPRHGRPPMVVQAGDVRVRVVGTRFAVTRMDDSARVDVAHGTVEVSAGGHTSLVHDGEAWTAPEPAHTSPAPAAVAAPEPMVQAPAVAADLPMAKGRLHLGARVPQRLSRSHVAAQQPTDETAPALAVVSRPASEAPASARSTQGAIVQPDFADQQLFEQASEIEKHDPSQAIATYGRLAAGSGRWAVDALFAQGRLEIDRGDTGEGRRILGSYLARYPHGPNAADARLLLDRMK